MQNKCYILFIGILLCISYEHGCTAQSIWNPSFEEDISQFIEDIFDCRHLPGLSFAVVQVYTSQNRCTIVIPLQNINYWINFHTEVKMT